MQESQNEPIRKPAYPINPLILNRWSPRSMTGQELDDENIMSLFEAARWAPSSFNNQPWRFIYAKRNT
ncbi:MAG: nitroreductase family protein, partial [Nitrososphaeraceae archaeon]